MIACMAFAVFSINAVSLKDVRFHDEATDTTRITELLTQTKEQKFEDPNALVGYLARTFLGTPYVAHTLEGDTEMLTVNLDELDCTTYVETVIALAYTVQEGRTSWRDYIYNLERIRYRNGEMNGYGSRLHYVCDWIIDNTHRGNFKEATTEFPSVNYTVKTIDYMSAHRDSYPALKDSVEYEKIKNAEIGYMSHRYPYIKWENLAMKDTRNAFKDGDILTLTTKEKGLDVSHLGFVAIVDGTPHLMHASLKEGKVIIDPLTLYEYMRRNKALTGMRVIRLNNW